MTTRDRQQDEREVSIASSYVRHNARWWNVSTIYRESSALVSDLWYEETIVWEWNPETKVRGAMLACGSKPGHAATVASLISNGELPTEDDA